MLGYGAHLIINRFIVASWFLLVRVVILENENKFVPVHGNFGLIRVGLRGLMSSGDSLSLSMIGMRHKMSGDDDSGNGEPFD